MFIRCPLYAQYSGRLLDWFLDLFLICVVAIGLHIVDTQQIPVPGQ